MEEGVVEGLKNQLMAPALVEEFISAFHDELNRKSQQMTWNAAAVPTS